MGLDYFDKDYVQESRYFKINLAIKLAQQDEIVHRRGSSFSGIKLDKLRDLLCDDEVIGVWKEENSSGQTYRKHNAWTASRLEEALRIGIIGTTPPYLLRVYRKNKL